MLVILGLVILIAALVVGIVGVLANDGDAHELQDGFSVFGYDVTGSTGTLFLYGIVVGAVGLLGLTLLLAGVRRRRRGRAARHRVDHPRRASAVAPERDDWGSERNTGDAGIPGAEGDGRPPGRVG